MKKKLPQNILTLLQDIGENLTLFNLYLLTKDTSWTVYKNLGDKGCDIILQHNNNTLPNNKGKIKIEVKTRQRRYTTSKRERSKSIIHLSLSPNEYKHCDFVIGYWQDRNTFFIVPKNKLKPGGKTKKIYRIIIGQNKDGSFSKNAQHFHENWDLIKDRMMKV